MTNLTQERANKLTNILTADPNQARELLAQSPEDALAKINGGLGGDFTLDEIKAYGAVLVKSIELGDDALSNVAGGAGSGDMEEDFLGTAAAVVGILYVSAKTADIVIGWFRN